MNIPSLRILLIVQASWNKLNHEEKLQAVKHAKGLSTTSALASETTMHGDTRKCVLFLCEQDDEIQI